MLNKFVVIAAAAAAMLMVSAVGVQPADAKKGSWGGTHHFTGARQHHAMRQHHFRHVPRFHHRRFFVSAPVVYSSYNDDCYSLKRRAITTGSPYWWHRYRACLYG